MTKRESGPKKDVFQVTSDKLIEKVKEVVHDANVKKIIVKDKNDKVLLTIPVTWGAAGVIATVVLAPWLAALGAIAALAAKCTIEVERQPS
ncbi:MAG TPA: DUF4342 domain-containing protein [Candidatus Bathyarchaeia archaeon]|nr:DUF4342 domain-containing protein [Candidatus Bathyarchaeia archaeon]